MKVLIVDDDESTRDVLREILEEEGLLVSTAANGAEALDILKIDPLPIVVSDIKMAEFDGMKLLRTIKSLDLKCIVILMTAFGNVETTLEAIKCGAFDYIGKPFRVDDLKAVVARAKQHYETTIAGEPLRLEPRPKNDSEKLVGKSAQMVEVYKTAGRAALSDSSVLLFGESGTGKELIARLIHDNSERKRSAFIPVNCGALVESLLESELFGHVKGAFTGAIANKRGLVQEADSGTLFLDEIGDMPLPLQVKLLRVLQGGEVRPVGGEENHQVDVRVIAATHQDLEALVKQGKFREDLYYRLKVISVHLPALRERSEDIPELAAFFVSKNPEAKKKNVSRVADDALELLLAYSWPGNIRELKHSLERAVAMTRTTILFPEDFPPELTRVSLPPPLPAAADSSGMSLDELEKQHILGVLKSVNYSKAKAARLLGISRVTLYRKAKLYGVHLEARSG